MNPQRQVNLPGLRPSLRCISIIVAVWVKRGTTVHRFPSALLHHLFPCLTLFYIEQLISEPPSPFLIVHQHNELRRCLVQISLKDARESTASSGILPDAKGRIQLCYLFLFSSYEYHPFLEIFSVLMTLQGYLQ